MKQDVKTAAIGAIVRQKNLDPATVTAESTLEELGITSLDAITIVYEIEEEFDVEVPNEALERLHTVRDMIEGIEGLIEARA